MIFPLVIKFHVGAVVPAGAITSPCATTVSTSEGRSEFGHPRLVIALTAALLSLRTAAVPWLCGEPLATVPVVEVQFAGTGFFFACADGEMSKSEVMTKIPSKRVRFIFPLSHGYAARNSACPASCRAETIWLAKSRLGWRLKYVSALICAGSSSCTISGGFGANPVPWQRFGPLVRGPA